MVPSWFLFPNQYDGRVVRIVEENTVDVMVDIGFSSYRQCRVQVFAINGQRKQVRNGGVSLKGSFDKLKAGDGVHIVTYEPLTESVYPADLCFYDEQAQAEIVFAALLIGQGEQA